MKSAQKIVISASRRTDIPAFYMPWFMAHIHKGSFEISNPYNQKVSVIAATPDRVHTIVFWSKDFGRFISARCGEKLQDMGYHLFFNFTINSELRLLEPHVPCLEKRFDQLAYLCQHFKPEAVTWRFDPICFFKTANRAVQDNLGDFSRIAENAARFGITRCVTSFRDDYSKITRRTASMDNFEFLNPPIKTQKEIVLHMQSVLGEFNIRLAACCEKKLLAALPAESGISQSACIPNDLLVKLFGGRLSLKRDTGQRVAAGCGCKVSIDIGSYRQQPCYHNCLFCYANPASGFNNRPADCG